jgi:8-oxo-dGTP diphosphatase
MPFHYLARGIVFVNRKVLLAHQKGAEHTFLPGGHIEFGERAEAALLREIAEETGMQADVKRFIGAVECAWVEGDQHNHEIDLLFEVDVPELDSNEALQSCEPHLDFIWSRPGELKAHNLLPEALIECLVNWEAGYRGYWGSAF